ncbi:MAG TPA: VOC family protein [Flavobacterium sp.]|jgi:predicted 3-demethylubiquinone-9 3-methyltransferase (glyoxalase superfamily)
MINTIQPIMPNLWFNTNAEQAVKFYASIFKESSVGRKTYFGKEGVEIHGMKEGTVMTVEFTLNGQPFVALNGGPIFKFTEAVSFIIPCDTQEEVDHYWNRLKEGGDESAQQCGWLKDQFGLSWQVVPKILNVYLNDPDTKKAGRVMRAMLQMKKLDIAALRSAYAGQD